MTNRFLLLFPGRSVDRKLFRKASKQRADHFGSSFAIGESRIVDKDTFGFALDETQFHKVEQQVSRYGGAVLQINEATWAERSRHLLGDFAGLASQDYKTKPRRREVPRRKQRSHSIEGGKLTRKSAFETQRPQEAAMKIVEQRYVRAAASFPAARLDLDESGDVKPNGTKQATLRPGNYFVQGIDEKAGIATISPKPDHGGVVYNVRLAVLERVGSLQAPKAEGQKNDLGSLRKRVIERFQKNVAGLSEAKLRELAEMDGPPPDELGPSADIDAPPPPPAEEEPPPPPPGGEMGMTASVPISKADFEKKMKNGKAAYMGEMPVVMIQDQETGIVVMVQADIDSDLVSKPKKSGGGDNPFAKKDGKEKEDKDDKKDDDEEGGEDEEKKEESADKTDDHEPDLEDETEIGGDDPTVVPKPAKVPAENEEQPVKVG